MATEVDNLATARDARRTQADIRRGAERFAAAALERLALECWEMELPEVLRLLDVAAELSKPERRGRKP